MPVQRIALVELYVHDLRSAINYFCSGMGFSEAASAVGADRTCSLLRQGTVQLLLTSGPVTRDFLNEHGDGVADIALACDDVAAAEKAARAAGAPVGVGPGGVPVVPGFGAVTHSLVPTRSDWRPEPPPGVGWATTETSARAPGRIELLDHVAICLDGGSLEGSADFYREAFGLARYYSEYIDTGAQGMDSIVVRSPSGEVTFTLVAPDPGKEPGQLDAFLTRNGGPGVQHLAFLVPEVIPAVHEFRARGVEFLSTPDTYYRLLSERSIDLREEITDLRAAQVLADRDEWGYLLQLFSRSPHERNTLFYELIQRRGSRGFGSANIRALYDAVERDRLAAG